MLNVIKDFYYKYKEQCLTAIAVLCSIVVLLTLQIILSKTFDVKESSLYIFRELPRKVIIAWAIVDTVHPIYDYTVQPFIILWKAITFMFNIFIYKHTPICLWLKNNYKYFIYLPVFVLTFYITVAPLYSQLPMRLFVSNGVILQKISKLYKKAIIFDSITLILTVQLFLCFMWMLLHKGSLIFPKSINFYNSVTINSYTLLAANLLFFVTILFLKMSRDIFLNSKRPIEYFFLIILSVFFSTCAISANDIFSMFLCLEGLSVCLYMLSVVSDVKSNGSVESALKYFFIGSLSSLLSLIGISFIYSFYGSVNFLDIVDFHNFYKVNQKRDFLLVLGTLLVTLNFLFKLSIPPMHVWSPEVFTGIWIHPVAFSSTVVKFANFAVFINWYYVACKPLIYTDISLINWVIILMSLSGMFIGATEAIHQTKLKKFLAYTSINQLSLCVLALTTVTTYGFASAMIHAYVYTLTSLCLFYIMFKMSKKTGRGIVYLADLSKYTFIEPSYTLVLVLIIFTLSGTPPTIMFFTKLLVLKSLLVSGKTLCAFIALLLNVYSSFYYIKLIKIILTRGYDFDTDLIEVGVDSDRQINLLTFTTNLDIAKFSNSTTNNQPNVYSNLNNWYQSGYFYKVKYTALKGNGHSYVTDDTFDNTTFMGNNLFAFYVKSLEAFTLLFILFFISTIYVINDLCLEIISNLMTSCWLALTLDSTYYLTDQMLYMDRFVSTSEALLIFLKLT